MTDDSHNQMEASVIQKLQALAFQEMCQHLRDRSDDVSNIDMMAMTGFCRNCLAKWMVLGARKLVDGHMDGAEHSSLPINALNAFGYDEAAELVYGVQYPEWKKQHQKKATAEQMARFEASQPIHAKHDKSLLAKRPIVAAPSKSLGSNVCCQELPPPPAPSTTIAKHTRTLPPYVPPSLPPASSTRRLAVLTVSDRAFRQEYATGDLSGPAVVSSIRQLLGGDDQAQAIETAVVPDDAAAIQEQIRSWTDKKDDQGIDCILTTGGTGFAIRDVTPEAVRELLTVELAHVMPWVTGECARRHQPLSSLSRGVAGICGNHRHTVIATLPGNPKGVAEMMPLVFPLLLHAVEELKVS